MELETRQLERNRPFASWETLLASCQAALSLSNQVAARLRQGATAAELVPLLQREAALARQLQTDIHHLDRQFSPDSEDGQRTRLLRQMRELLDREQENHRLLSTRGVKLNRPRPYRYNPRKR